MKLDKDLLELLELFRSKGVEFLVVGGHAVGFHGHIRYTEDLDLFVRPDIANGERIVAALHEFGFASLGLTAADFAADDRVVQLGHAPNRVDLLTKLYGVEFAEAWARKAKGDLAGAAVWIIGRDDLIRNKLATARPQDIADVEHLEKLG